MAFRFPGYGRRFRSVKWRYGSADIADLQPYVDALEERRSDRVERLRKRVAEAGGLVDDQGPDRVRGSRAGRPPRRVSAGAGRSRGNRLRQRRRRPAVGALLNGWIGDQASRDFVLEQMKCVTADGWDLGSAGAPALWKGDSGPGIDGRYLLRQMGAIMVGGTEYAVTLALVPGDGDLVTG